MTDWKQRTDPAWPDENEEFNHYLDARLCDYMGWENVDSPDGACLRGTNPMNGKCVLIRSHSSDPYMSNLLAKVIVESMRYPNGGKVQFCLQGYLNDGPCLNHGLEWRATFWRDGVKLGSTLAVPFEGRSWSPQHAIGIAALRLFRKLGPLQHVVALLCEKCHKAYERGEFDLDQKTLAAYAKVVRKVKTMRKKSSLAKALKDAGKDAP